MAAQGDRRSYFFLRKGDGNGSAPVSAPCYRYLQLNEAATVEAILLHRTKSASIPFTPVAPSLLDPVYTG